MMAKRESTQEATDDPGKSSASASNTHETQNPEDTLTRLQADRKACQEKISAKTKELEALTEGIGLLEGLVKEINQLSTAYGKLYGEKLHADSEGLKASGGKKSTIIDCALSSDDRQKIDGIIKEVAEEIKERESQLASREEALTEATAGVESANARVEEARMNYIKVKGYPTRIQADISEAERVRKEIESLGEGNEWKKIYVLLASLKWILTKAELKTPQVYQDELRTAATVLHEATQWRDEQEQKMEQAQAEVDNAREALANAKQNRNATILHRLGEGEAPPSGRRTAPMPVERTARGREPKRGG